MISDHTWSLSAVLNQYETAIKSVGDIIEDYDTDKLFPVLGFGKIEKKGGSVCQWILGNNFFYGGPDLDKVE